MSQLKDVNFDLIRYANCWEDPNVLLQALQINSSSKVLSIASAGDNSFSLLSESPEMVVGIDVNDIQLYLCDLKKTGITHLDRQSFLVLLGFEKGDAVGLYNQIKKDLKSDTKAYFDARTTLIEQGLIHQGKFENYFKIFRTKVLKYIHSHHRIDQLFSEKTAADQSAFYKNEWNSWRWKALFQLFFSKPVMGRLGRDKAFLKEVEVNVGQFIYKKAGKHLSSKEAQTNFMLHYIMKGKYDILPHYVQEEVYEKVKANISKISFYKGFAEDAFSEFGSFNRMNLSNIFEYMDLPTFCEVGKQIKDGSDHDTQIAYWNLMVPRNLNLVDTAFEYEEELSKSLSASDNGFFYNQMIVNHVR